MKDEKWLRDELKALIKNCKENARENRRQSKDCRSSEPKRAEFLEGGAEAMDYAAKEIRRVLDGKTSMEALADLMKNAR